MLKRYDNIIYKQFLRSKGIIKVILSSITRIRLIIYIEDPEEAPGVNYVYIEEDTKIEETIIVDIVTTGHPVKSNDISMSRESPAHVRPGQLRCPETPTHVRPVTPTHVPLPPLYLRPRFLTCSCSASNVLNHHASMYLARSIASN